MIISIIAAMDLKQGIGYQGALPWHLSSDLKRFKRLTMGHHIVMGRRTYESIGKPLPGRINVVLTRSPSYAVPGCKIVHSFDEAVNIAREANESELFVIGGGEVFDIALPIANKLYLTIVNASLPADTFFPVWDDREWDEVERMDIPADDSNEYDSSFVVYKRKKPAGFVAQY